MPRLLSFAGQTKRLPFAVLALAVFLSQHLAVALAAGLSGRWPALNWEFALMPLRWLLRGADKSPAAAICIVVAWCLLAAWALAALAFRRSTDARVTEWTVPFAITPVIQIPVILFLCVVWARPGAAADPAERELKGRANLAYGAQGVIAGTVLTAAAVALGALVFGSYGYGIFVLAPFLVGLVAAYLANRGGDIGGERTFTIVMLALLFGGLALLVVALEGVVCIVLAAPLAAGIAIPGGLLGRTIALRQAAPKQALSVVLLLPLAFAFESLAPPSLGFESEQSIEIDAGPDVVWREIVTMTPIDERPALPGRLGMAYPISAEIAGGGVGAVRRGTFSTGIARERVTAWEPGRQLAFVVETDVPAMRELSPYDNVHAPHVAGYFRTLETRFELLAVSPGQTRLTVRASHELRLDPVAYWLPMARLAVAQNAGRVLRHVRRRAEARD